MAFCFGVNRTIVSLEALKSMKPTVVDIRLGLRGLLDGGPYLRLHWAQMWGGWTLLSYLGRSRSRHQRSKNRKSVRQIHICQPLANMWHRHSISK
jgi:hypothetical protein